MLNTVLGILLIVMAVFLVVTILLQSSKDHRMSGTIAGSAETFFGKQKGKTIDGILNKITAVVCVLFFISVLAMYVTNDNQNAVIPGANGDISADIDNNIDGDNESKNEEENNDAVKNDENGEDINSEDSEDSEDSEGSDADADNNVDSDADADANDNTGSDTDNAADGNTAAE